MKTGYSPEARMPVPHPPRPIRQSVTRPWLPCRRSEVLCPDQSGPLIAPEKLLRALLLQVSYSLRSSSWLSCNLPRKH